ncbi:binding-protein-dependent transport systems inner membrane component [Caldicellulosiruptor hydrothermalis 108]|uniref:Binding-protein-dependent transport systems inner membrane component n=1 Tax=Caldicellulosiruptor hydrothermalis (strain DSM 18901 / VKM B-2411 / 108) TaxID=632292 RepID=E4Q926_CALH1|nr:ABC transporter permease [Caldicellulosiruptor hydrothermalis]ADQ08075.1 binding-protein-dependent transport systems inner membrane component [Caldicellulosiruptor hydrothermalis 108]
MKIKAVFKKVLMSFTTVLCAVLLTFFLLRLTPGSAIDGLARQLAQTNGITLEAAYERVAKMVNYDPREPLHKQLIRYVNELLHGNLGTSMIYQTVTVNEIVAKALPWTVFVLSISLLISFLIGIQLGTRMAWKRNSILEPIVSIYATITSAVPGFIIAILLLVIFAYNLNWFPYNGAYDIDVTPGFNLPFLWSVLKHAFLPILTYVITSIGGWALAMKGSAISVLGEDYVNAAYARGLSDRTIMKNYVRRNALLPLITSLAMNFGFMISGSALIENIFSYPGMGYYIAQASSQRDYTLMQGLLLVTATAVIIANLIADLIYSKLDPRVSIEE